MPKRDFSIVGCSEARENALTPWVAPGGCALDTPLSTPNKTVA
jgi:hypothetical protein